VPGEVDPPPACRRWLSWQEVERVALRHRVALALVGMLVISLLALLPLALISVLGNVGGLPYDRVYSLTAVDSPPAPSHSRLHLEVIALDPWLQLVTLRVAGHHTCPPGCSWQDQIVFFSLRTDSPAAEGLPPSATVTLPASAGQVTQTIQLPVRGEAIRYPFDSYELQLGLSLQRVQPDGTVQTLSAVEAQGHLFLTVQNRVPLLSLDGPGSRAPQRIRAEGAPDDYLEVARLTLHRPVWLPVLAVMLILLISAATAYALFLRPWVELVVGAGGLVLGVLGIRAVLLPSNITYTTAVDLSLSVVLLCLLGGISIRALLVLWDRNRLPRPRWVRADSGGARSETVKSPNGTARADSPRSGPRRQRAEH
jgi:hypothetical protein